MPLHPVVSITVWTPPGTREQLNALLERGRRTAAAIRRDMRPPEEARAALRARRRAEIAEFLDAQRRSGQLLDTVAAVLENGVRRELAERPGFDQVYPDPPREALLPGRWPGARDGGFPEPVTARVDASLTRQVRAACWWTSAEAIDQLRAWRDANPYLEFELAPKSALRGYNELADEVTNPGQVWRAALDRMLPPLDDDPSES